MATSSGIVKKTPLTAFSRPLKSGIIAIGLHDDDHLIGVDITDGSQSVMLFTSAGKGIRFDESNVRAMGRTAAGVRGIKLGEGHRVISLLIAREDAKVLCAVENGYGNCTAIDSYPVKGRGGMGVISIKTTRRNGAQIGAVLVDSDDEIMLITDGGTLVRTRVADISVTGRSTQGVKLINLSSQERLIGIERIVTLDEEDDAESADGDEESAVSGPDNGIENDPTES
jgi:DNA gyrase subunit A